VAQNKNARHVTAAISCILKSRFEFFFRNRFSRSASDLDVDPPRFLPPSNCYGGGISSRRPRGDTLLALFPEFSAWVRSSANFCSLPVHNGIGVSANAPRPIIARGPSISVFVCLPTPRSCVLQKRLNGSRCRLEWGQTRVEPKSHHFSKSVSKTPLHSVTGLQGAVQIHTHTRLTPLCSGLPWWAGTRKEKPIWILLKRETVSGSGISWAICKSASRS